MKRFTMGFFHGAPAMFEQPDGDYVKWSDVQPMLRPSNPPIPTNPQPLDQVPYPYSRTSKCDNESGG